MSAWLNKLFAPDITAKSEFQYRKPEMEKVIEQNRKSLSMVDNWIDDVAFENSFFKYGVPDFIKTEINKPIDNSLTYTDAMVYIAKEHFQKNQLLRDWCFGRKKFFPIVELAG